MIRFTGSVPHAHDAPGITGILLTNLGTPVAPTPAGLRRFLAEFLSDPRVIELPRWAWWPILHGIILRLRPGRLAETYREIWTGEGSPLMVHTRRICAAVESSLVARDSGAVRVEMAMRYGSPSIAEALDRMAASRVRRLVVLPLYPQYSATTTGTTLDAVSRELCRWRWVPELRFINHYHDEPLYIEALAHSVETHQSRHGRPDRLLFSFHGLPQKYFLKGDPYFCHCQKTARLVAQRLSLPDGAWAVSFQSRFGFDEWLKPYTDKVLAAWGKRGIRHVQVVCPGFAADCLETLEEIQSLGRKQFLAAGGREYSYVPALNNHPDHVAALMAVIDRHVQGWPGNGAGGNAADAQRELQESARRAAAMDAEDPPLPP